MILSHFATFGVRYKFRRDQSYIKTPRCFDGRNAPADDDWADALDLINVTAWRDTVLPRLSK
jgi:hypothetical protein